MRAEPRRRRKPEKGTEGYLKGKVESAKEKGADRGQSKDSGRVSKP